MCIGYQRRNDRVLQSDHTNKGTSNWIISNRASDTVIDHVDLVGIQENQLLPVLGKFVYNLHDALNRGTNGALPTLHARIFGGAVTARPRQRLIGDELWTDIKSLHTQLKLFENCFALGYCVCFNAAEGMPLYVVCSCVVRSGNT